MTGDEPAGSQTSFFLLLRIFVKQLPVKRKNVKLTLVVIVLFLLLLLLLSR